MANTKGTFENEAAGWTVDAAGRGIKEGLSHLDWNSPAALQTLAAVPELIRVAVPVQTRPNTEEKTKHEISQFRTLVAPILVEGEVLRARITISGTNMGRGKYYGHRLERLDIEKSGALPGGLEGFPPPTDPQHPDTISLGQIIQGFKPHKGKKQ